MSPVSLTLDLVLAALLLITLIFGLRLDRRLKSLNAGQAEFQAAIADLDRTATRAETGLADLRASIDEAAALLAGRIEMARELALKLETLTARATRMAQAASTPAGSLAERSGAAPPPAEPLILSRRAALAPARAAWPQAVHSRAQVDDELFDRPTERRRAGARP